MLGRGNRSEAREESVVDKEALEMAIEESLKATRSSRAFGPDADLDHKHS